MLGFLGTGTVVEVLKHRGTWHRSSDLLNRAMNTGAILCVLSRDKSSEKYKGLGRYSQFTVCSMCSKSLRSYVYIHTQSFQTTEPIESHKLSHTATSRRQSPAPSCLHLTHRWPREHTDSFRGYNMFTSSMQERHPRPSFMNCPYHALYWRFDRRVVTPLTKGASDPLPCFY